MIDKVRQSAYFYYICGMKTTDNNIIGRHEELEALREALYSKESEFVAVYGRRRVGKTYLVNKAFGGKFAFQYTGLENKNNKEQIKAFHLALLEQGLPKCAYPKNWIEAFYQLQHLLESKTGQKQYNNKKIIFIDELPWMDAPKSAFVEALGNFWNRWAAWTDDIVLIVCGSATSWMFNKVLRNHGGLYNRVTKRIALYPFNLAECEQLSQRLNLGWDRKQLAEAYMVVGGIPHYWNKFSRKLSLSANIDRLFFEKGADMVVEYEVLFSSLFSHPDAYEAIIHALSQKKKGLSNKEIAETIGYATSGRLTTILKNLELCGFIEKVSQPQKKRRDALYQLIDNFVLFFNEFVNKKEAKPNYWTTHLDSPAHTAWSGLAFERLCFQHKKQIAKAIGISGVYAGWYAWSANADTEKAYPGMQVDMVIDRADGVVNLCEAKFSSKPYVITPGYLSELRLRQGRYREEVAPKKAVHITMITASGVADNPQKQSINSFVDLDDLFAQ
jgi:AAA+ ATPase superfamily predicted ATPase